MSQLDRLGTLQVVNGSEVLLGSPFVLDADNIKSTTSNSTPPVLTGSLPAPNLLLALCQARSIVFGLS